MRIRSVGNRMASTAVGLLLLVGMSLAITSVTTFAPEGVPLSRRAEYESKVAQILLRSGRQVSGTSADGPAVTIAEESFDFGLLDPHTTAHHQFVIKNTGNDDLLLEPLGTSCKCTVSSVDGRPTKPGESAQVTLTWNTGYQSEVFEQSALIKTNDPSRPELRLSVSGRVRAELALGIQSLHMPGSDRGKLAISSTFLYSQVWKDFRILSATSDLPGFQWSVEPIPNDALPVPDLEASSAWRLNIMTVGHQVGVYQGTVKLTVVPDSGGEPIERELAVEGRVRSPIAFIDEDLDAQKGLDLGLITRGRAYSRSLIVRVRDASTRQLAVLDIEPKELQADLSPTKQPGAYRLTLTVPMDSGLASFASHDKHGFVQIGDPEDRSFHNWLPLYGGIINPPSSPRR